MYLLRFAGASRRTTSSAPRPEALVTVRTGEAVLHPIAGTRPRGATPEEDAALAAELLADPKERAEHVMLVDLGRNDLGRVCAPGTVEVVDFMSIERYSPRHAHRLHRRRRGGAGPDGVRRADRDASRPARCPVRRSRAPCRSSRRSSRPAAACTAACVGYLDFAGDMDMAIAIRTAVLRDGVAYVQAGGGLVADSDPVAEEQECRNKAAAVLRADRGRRDPARSR